MIRFSLFFWLAAISALCVLRTHASDTPIHGLWLWKTSSILAPPGSAEALRDFARANDINEVYVSISRRDDLSEDAPLISLIDLLHGSHIRVEALLDSIDADMAGKPREELLALARRI